MNEILVNDLRAILAAQSNILLIDVRTPLERAGGYIPGSIHIPLDELNFKLSEIAEIAKTHNIYLQCRSGVRSSNATTILLQAGVKNVFNVRGGITAWEQAGFPISR